jgi:hypothetical protein
MKSILKCYFYHTFKQIVNKFKNDLSVKKKKREKVLKLLKIFDEGD